MADLSQLFQTNPWIGSLALGQQVNQENQNNALKQQELSQLMQQRANMHPLEMDAKRLGNESLGAQIPGQRATSQSLQRTADFGKRTLDSDVEAHNAKNKNQMYMSVGGHLGTVANGIEGLSDIEKPAALARELEALGAPPELKQKLMMRYSSVAPAQLAERLRADSDRLLRETPAYAQNFDQESLRTSADIVKQRSRQDHEKELERMRIESGKYDKIPRPSPTGESELAKARSARERHQKLIDLAMQAKQNGDDATAAHYMQRAEAVRPQAEAELNAFNPKPGEINAGAVAGLPTNPPLSIAPPGGGAQGAGAALAGRVTVVSPDGKRGSIPANQLEQALKQGYKKAQ
jgi:hypothetical protein